MTSTGPSQLPAGQTALTLSDAPSREPTTLRNPSIDPQSASVVDAWEETPIVGKTVNAAELTHPWYSSFEQTRPKRSLMDRLRGVAPAPVWMQSETLDLGVLNHATRLAVSGQVYANMATATRTSLTSGPVRHLATHVAPSTLYMAHFGAAVIAAAARGDNDMQARRIFPTFNETASNPPIQHCSVALFATTEKDGLVPVLINTDGRVHTTADGRVRALQREPMFFDLTYPMLENAFSKLTAAGGAFAFKPFDAHHRAGNVEAIGHALTAITGSPTKAHALHEIAQETLLAALGDHHQAVLLTFPPEQAVAVDEGSIPDAQWVTHRGTPTAEDIAQNTLPPEYTLLADVPYAVTDVDLPSGTVELVNVLKQSQDPSWYEDDAEGIAAPLAQQKVATMRVPLSLLTNIAGAHMFTSPIVYARPETIANIPVKYNTPQGPKDGITQAPVATNEDIAANAAFIDAITMQFLQSACAAFQNEPVIANVLGSLIDIAQFSVQNELITLSNKETNAPIAYLLRTENGFCWFENPDLKTVREALAKKLAQVTPLKDSLLAIARYKGFVPVGQSAAPAQTRAVVKAAPGPLSIHEEVAELIAAHILPLRQTLLEAAQRAPEQIPWGPVIVQLAELCAARLVEQILPKMAALPKKTSKATLAEIAFFVDQQVAAMIDPLLQQIKEAPEKSPLVDRRLSPMAILQCVGVPMMRAVRNQLKKYHLEMAQPSQFEPASLQPLSDDAVAALQAPPTIARNVDAAIAGTPLARVAPADNSVWYHALNPDMIAPSSLETTHFAAAATAMASLGADMSRQLTMRAMALGPNRQDTRMQDYNLAVYTPSADSAAMRLTSIQTTNAVSAYTLPVTNVSGRRAAYEGSLPSHAWAVWENGLQKLAEHAPQYAYKPFASADAWDNSAAIGHALSAITGTPAQMTQLTWQMGKNNDLAHWPGQQLVDKLQLVTFPDGQQLPPSSWDIAVDDAFDDTPSLLIRDANNNAVVMPNLPYVVTRVVDMNNDGRADTTRVLLRNVLANSGDPSWYRDEAPSLDRIIARQSVTPLNIQVTQATEQPGLNAVRTRAMLSLSVEALRRVGATVHMSQLPSTPIPGAPQMVRRPQYDDVQIQAAQGLRDSIDQLLPGAEHAAFRGWLSQASFTALPPHNNRNHIAIHESGPDSPVIASFVRTLPGVRSVSREGERLLQRYAALAGRKNVLEVERAKTRMQGRTATGSNAAYAQAYNAMGEELQQVLNEGQAVEVAVTKMQAEGRMPQGGVRRVVDTLPGDETTLLELLQEVFAERQQAAPAAQD